MDQHRPVIEVISVSATIGAIAGWLPPVAALFTILWTVMCIVINFDSFMAKLRRWCRPPTQEEPDDPD